MIVNSFSIRKPVDFQLDLIKASPKRFYLTGSRYFLDGKVEETADWDFFVEASREVETLLRTHGFRRIESEDHYRGDPATAEVYRWKLNNQQIDVQLIQPSYMQAKVRAQGILLLFAKEFYMKDKEERKKLWRHIYSIISP